jgi:hypothetical protein
MGDLIPVAAIEHLPALRTDNEMFFRVIRSNTVAQLLDRLLRFEVDHIDETQHPSDVVQAVLARGAMSPFHDE